MILDRVVDIVFQAVNTFDVAKNRFNALMKQKKTPQVRVKTKVKASPVKIPKVEVAKKDNRGARKAHEIRSERAQLIMANIKEHGLPVIKRDAHFDGKTSLAYALWAFDAAARADMHDGISTHDASALIFDATGVQSYPVSLARMMSHYPDYFTLVSMERTTKRFLLTERGSEAAKKLH